MLHRFIPLALALSLVACSDEGEEPNTVTGPALPSLGPILCKSPDSFNAPNQTALAQTPQGEVSVKVDVRCGDEVVFAPEED